MAGIVDDVAFRCPDTRIVMIGYSQGAQVARKAASQVTATQNVNSVILFGDPLAGSNVVMFSGQNKALTICNNGDLICGMFSECVRISQVLILQRTEGRPTVRAPHLDVSTHVFRIYDVANMCLVRETS